jgi:hypothetical protein
MRLTGIYEVPVLSNSPDRGVIALITINDEPTPRMLPDGHHEVSSSLQGALLC